MVIDLKYFEQTFDEKTLKKGLGLFEKSKVELNERSGYQAFLFTVDGFLVSIKKKGDKVLEYRCACHKPKPCEHVSAVLFYFQQDTLGLKPKKPGAGRSNSKPSRYEIFCQTIQQQVHPFLIKEKLNHEQIQKLSEALAQLISKKRTAPQEQFMMRLALVTEFSNILTSRFSGDETSLTDLFSKTKAQIANYCSKKLNAEEFSAIEQAAFRSIKTNAALKSGAFGFLVPLLISRTKNKLLYEKLSFMLSKRKHKHLYSEKLDKLLVVQLQVNLKLKEAEQGSSFKIASEPLELIIARAENLFFDNKTNKAFDWLETNYHRIKKEKAFFSVYLDYIIQKTHEKNKRQLEIHYLEESFIHGLYLPT